VSLMLPCTLAQIETLCSHSELGLATRAKSLDPGCPRFGNCDTPEDNCLLKDPLINIYTKFHCACTHTNIYTGRTQTK
jgi:hypothetical protein